MSVAALALGALGAAVLCGRKQKRVKAYSLDRQKAEAWIEGSAPSNSRQPQPTLIAESQAARTTPAKWGSLRPTLLQEIIAKAMPEGKGETREETKASNAGDPDPGPASKLHAGELPQGGGAPSDALQRSTLPPTDNTMPRRRAKARGNPRSASPTAGPLLPGATTGTRPDHRNDDAMAAKAWKEKGTDSPWFRRWFGASKVADEGGKPLVVYHGVVRRETKHRCCCRASRKNPGRDERYPKRLWEGRGEGFAMD